MNNEKPKKDQNLINLTQLDPAEKEKYWEIIRAKIKNDPEVPEKTNLTGSS